MPNLNAIEALWKAMRAPATHNRYHDSFRAFADAVWGFFETTLPNNWHRFRDRVSDCFHIIQPEDFGLSGYSKIEERFAVDDEAPRAGCNVHKTDGHDFAPPMHSVSTQSRCVIGFD